nr:restriction endonuclease subunit S [Clostridium paraputrificum]
MQRLLTKGIGHTEFKKTEVGEIPIEWEIKSLGKVFKLSSGEFLSQKNIIDGPYPVYGGNGITGYHNEFKHKDSKIVIGRVGAKCGCVCRSIKESWITDNALYINEKLCEFDDEFMLYLLYYLDLNKFANQNAQPVISGQKIYVINIALPNLEEQKKIANILSSIDMQIEEYENKNIKLEELKKGLMQQLLTGKIRVKI